MSPSPSRIRHALLPGAALLMMIAAVAAHRSTDGGGPTSDSPVLRVNGLQHDLGEVAAGSVVRTRLQIANAGGRRLVVNEQSCALCDDGVLPTIIISPGQSREIDLTWDTAGISGPLRQARTFTTNDPRRTSFQVEVSAQLVPLSSKHGQ